MQVPWQASAVPSRSVWSVVRSSSRRPYLAASTVALASSPDHGHRSGRAPAARSTFPYPSPRLFGPRSTCTYSWDPFSRTTAGESRCRAWRADWVVLVPYSPLSARWPLLPGVDVGRSCNGRHCPFLFRAVLFGSPNPASGMFGAEMTDRCTAITRPPPRAAVTRSTSCPRPMVGHWFAALAQASGLHPSPLVPSLLFFAGRALRELEPRRWLGSSLWSHRLVHPKRLDRGKFRPAHGCEWTAGGRDHPTMTQNMIAI